MKLNPDKFATESRKATKNFVLFKVLASVAIVFFGCLETNKPDRNIENSSSVNETASGEIIIEGEPAFQVSFKRDATFGDSEEVYFRFMGNISVDENNRVFISERNHIKVFDQDERFITSLGRQGRGPGEFNNFGGLQPKIAFGRLYAFDDVEQRINVYNLSNLEFEGTIPINSINWNYLPELEESRFENYFIAGDSLILAGLNEIGGTQTNRVSTRRYFYMDNKGKIISEEIFSHPDNGFYDGNGVPPPISPRSPVPKPSDRNSIIDVNEDGQIYWAWSEKIIIKVFDTTGSKLRTLIYPFENNLLDKEEVLEVFEYNPNLHQRAKNEDIPDTWPAMDYFFVDDENRIWISTISDNDDYFEWMVVSDKGAYLAKFKWKGIRKERHYSQREIKMVRNNYLYTKELNDETSQNEIVRYRIEFEESQ